MLASVASHQVRQGSEFGLKVAERRRYRRYPLDLTGRFMRSDKREYPCRLIDISCGGVAVASTSEVRSGERIVAYFDDIGGLEGQVVRIFPGGFAMALTVSAHKREKLAAQITWLVNCHEFKGAEARRHSRLAVSQTTNLTLDDGTVHPVRCLDVSVSGASVATPARPEVGTLVTLGRLKAKVARHHADGIAVQFVRLENIDSLKRYFG